METEDYIDIYTAFYSNRISKDVWSRTTRVALSQHRS